MKKAMKLAYLMILTLCVTTFATACEKLIAVEEVVLDKTEITVFVGDSVTLTAQVSPDTASDKQVVWSSDDESVVTVNGGVVTAVAKGTTVVTATAQGKTATCTVTVKEISVWNGSTASDAEMTEVFDESTQTYTITTAAQLAWIAQQVNANNNTFAGKTFILASDINLNNMPWNPIGNVNAYPSRTFSGVFDGNGFGVYGMTATDENDTNGEATAALFGSVYNATIKNLTVVGATVSGDHYTGVLVGYISDGVNVIDNCTVKNSSVSAVPALYGDEYDNGDKVGAIVGYATAVTITNCTVENVSVVGYRDVGGVIGYAGSGVTVEGNALKNVTVTQDDKNDYGKPENEKYVGEIVGRNGGATVENNAKENVTVVHKDAE